MTVKKETEKAYQIEYKNGDSKIVEWISKSLLDKKNGTFQLNEKGESIFKSKLALYEELIKNGFSA